MKSGVTALCILNFSITLDGGEW